MGKFVSVCLNFGPLNLQIIKFVGLTESTCQALKVNYSFGFPEHRLP